MLQKKVKCKILSIYISVYMAERAYISEGSFGEAQQRLLNYPDFKLKSFVLKAMEYETNSQSRAMIFAAELEFLAT